MNIPIMCRKRIIKDLTEISPSKSPLWSNGIYTYFDSSNIQTVYACLIGPEDTPYEDGFFGFRFKIPGEYPFISPKVEFLTTDGKVRFNPNLYACGKVCLSILGTWSGPPWTSVCTLSSVLLSLQSLLQPVPIQNEPGWEKIEAGNPKSESYNAAIEHEKFRIAIYEIVLNPSKFGMEAFSNLITQHFVRRFPHIKSRLNDLSSKYSNSENNLIKSHVYSMMTFHSSYDSITSKITKLYEKLIKNMNSKMLVINLSDVENIDYNEMCKIASVSDNMILDEDNEDEDQKSKMDEYQKSNIDVGSAIVPASKIKIKKVIPNVKASNFLEGYVMKYEDSYFISKRDSIGRARWKKTTQDVFNNSPS